MTPAIAFSQIVVLLLAEPTWRTIRDSTLIFLLLWLPWSQFAWSANAVSGNTREVRLLFLTATAAGVPVVRRSAMVYTAPNRVAMAVIVTGGFLVDLILLVTLVVEHLRIEGPRAGSASVDDGRVVDDAAQ